MNKVKDWLKKNNIDETVIYTYEVGGKKVKLNFNKMLSGVKRKMNSEAFIIKALENINKYYKDRDRLYEKDRVNEIENFLREMAMNIVYENRTDFTWEQLAGDYGYSVEFLKWWMKEKELEEHQMRCDHDDVDTYGTDGMFYNSVGECKKCNCACDNFLERADIDLVWRAWNHK